MQPLHAHASRDQFDRRAAAYGKSHILSDTSDIARAQQWFQATTGMALLDVACGGGHCGLFFGKAGLTITLGDLAPAMLERAAALFAEAHLSVETQLHPAEIFPYPNESFDRVTCRVAAHHFTNVPAFLRECRRVLKSEGRLLIIDGSVEDDAPAAYAWSHAVEKLRDPSHGCFLTPHQWTSTCMEAGFHVVHHDLQPFLMPDLEWYFDAAATPAENREKVRQLVAAAPQEVRRLFSIKEDAETDRITWQWQRLTLVATVHASP